MKSSMMTWSTEHRRVTRSAGQAEEGVGRTNEELDLVSSFCHLPILCLAMTAWWIMYQSDWCSSPVTSQRFHL